LTAARASSGFWLVMALVFLVVIWLVMGLIRLMDGF